MSIRSNQNSGKWIKLMGQEVGKSSSRGVKEVRDLSSRRAALYECTSASPTKEKALAITSVPTQDDLFQPPPSSANVGPASHPVTIATSFNCLNISPNPLLFTSSKTEDKKSFLWQKATPVRCDLSWCWRRCTQPTHLAVNGHPEGPLHRYPFCANPSFGLPYSIYLTVWCPYMTVFANQGREISASQHESNNDTYSRFHATILSVPSYSPQSRCQLLISVQVWKADWNDSRAEATDSGVV